MNGKNLTYNLLKLGVKLGVFSHSSNGDHSVSIPNVPNAEFLQKYLAVIEHMGLLKKSNGSYHMGSFKLSFSQREFKNTIPDYFIMYDYIAAMAPYRAVSEVHPNVLMSFEKDADVWDLFLENPFCRTYREAVDEILNLKNGDKVLDVGCGSVSPLFFAPKVGPNGVYKGVDQSKNLSRIGNNRLRKERVDWAEIKNLDFADVSVNKKFDYILCTDTINYMSNVSKCLKNMMGALTSRGKLLFFDIFPDLLDFDPGPYEFYNSLNKCFKGFSTSKSLTELISKVCKNASITNVGSNFLLVEKGIE